MSDSTFQAPPAASAGNLETPSPPRSDRALDGVRRYEWWVAGVGLLLLSYVIVRAAGTRPSYDAYGWLVWGYQTLHLNLDLGGAPSWKPLPFLFTVPFELVGTTHAVTLWMVFSTAVALSATIFAARITYRLIAADGTDGITRATVIIASALSGVAVLFIDKYAHYILSAQSDPMIVTLCLAAVDAHLCGRPRLAFACLVLASLGRPEAWPFAGLYGVWLWRAIPSARVTVAVGLAVIPVLWFGVPWITNGRPFVAGDLADNSVHRIVGNKFTGTYHRYSGLTLLPIKLMALVAVGIAVARRNRTVLGLAAAAALWAIVELAFALHGWPALPRYMFESAAIQCVLAGVGIGWVALALRDLLAPAGARGVARWVSVPVALVLALAVVPGAIGRIRSDNQDLTLEHWRTTQIARLANTIVAVGGRRHIVACGRPVTYVGLVSALAYFVRLNVGIVGHMPKQDLHGHRPIVLFTPGASGWTLRTAHLHRHMRLRCAGLNATVIFSRSHAGGQVVRHHVTRPV